MMRSRGQYGSVAQGRVHVGAFLVHTLELKQRYNNVKPAAAEALLNDLSSQGASLSVGTNRWEIALKEGTWVQLTWHPDSAALEVTITDRELRPADQVAADRRRYEALLRRITPRLQSFGATPVGGTIVGQTPTPRLAARTRAIRAVFDMYTQGTRMPYYIYAEVNGRIDKRSASSLDEANEIFFALEREPGEIYVAIFDPTDPLWPGPALDVYNAAPQERAPYGDRALVGFVRTPSEIEDELNQLHSEVMQFGQEVIEQEQNAANRIKEEPEYKEILAKWAAEEARLKTLPESPRAPFPDFLPGDRPPAPADAPRVLSMKRQKELQKEAADYFNRRVNTLPIWPWSRTIWDPFSKDWQHFRRSKIEISAQLWPGSGVWDRVQDYRKKLIEIRSKAPFKPTGPEPLSPEGRKDPSPLGWLADFGSGFKWVALGVLGIGGVLAVSSIASNLKKGRRS